jgi:hypothetical protein
VRGLVAAIADRNEAVGMFLAELLRIPYVMNVLGKVAAELAKTCKFERLCPK